jgi:threonine/homoserine/homoserine lactone efflux protein
VEVALGLGLGLGLGVVTGIPLGVVNVAVVELASRDRRGATWLGLGGALADTVHAGVAIAGWGALVAARPEVTRVLAVITAAVVAGYAVWVAMRTRRPEARILAPGPPARRLLTGVALTLPNPAALAAWTAVAAALFPRASPAVTAAAALGVGIGSALWFAALARLGARVRLGDRAWPARAVAAVLLAIAAVALARAL